MRGATIKIVDWNNFFFGEQFSKHKNENLISIEGDKFIVFRGCSFS
jgi:hypothetical protein